MAVITAGVIGTVATAGAAAPLAAAASASAASAAGVAGVAGAAGVAGTGAVGGVVGTGATVGGATGASGLATAGGIALGPIGWMILGTDGFYTFDCWKQVVHDESSTASEGKPLGEIMTDERIKNVEIETNNDQYDLPQLILENIWDERFRIDYVMLPSKQLTAHATKI
jgi:hypothetical protein